MRMIRVILGILRYRVDMQVLDIEDGIADIDLDEYI